MSQQLVAPWFATCDWGDCDGPTVGFRFDNDADGLSKATGYGWLPVCQRHFDEESDASRLYVPVWSHIDFVFDNNPCCRVCGLVRPAEGWTRPCKGSSELSLRVGESK